MTVEEAARQYFENPENSWEVRDVFIAAAKWQREQDRLEIANIRAKLWQDGFDDCRKQMMKEAVEGEVYFNPYPTISLDDCKDYDFKEGDKVRVIIVKEE